MTEWKRVAAVEDCPPGTSLELVVGNRIVALFNVDGTFYALDGICPHQGGPLGKGELTGSTVTCPWHGWQFDVCSGRHLLNARLNQPAFAVQVVADEVQIEVPADE